MATAAGSMTLEEFLALPETKPYRQDAPPVQLTSADVASGAPVLPDFAIPLADLFAEARRPSARET